MNVEQWQDLARQLEILPDFLIWESAEPVWQFRARLCAWQNITTFTEKMLPLMVEFITDPVRRDETFFDYLGLLWHEHDGLASGYSFHYLLDVTKTLGLELVGRIQFHGMKLHGQMLYRYWDSLGDDIRLRKLTMYELEELADYATLERDHVDAA